MKKMSNQTKLIIQLLSEYNDYDGVIEELEEKWIQITVKKLRDYKYQYKEEINRIKNEDNISELNNHFKKEASGYDIDKNTNEYIITYNRVNSITGEEEPITIKLDIDLVDNMMRDFSLYWNNFTQKQIIRKYSLDPHTWNVLKWRFSMYKQSNIFTDYTYEKSSEWDIYDAISESFDSKYWKKNDITEIYDKAFNKKAEEALKLKYYTDSVISYINDTLQVKPVKYKEFVWKKKVWTTPVYVSSDYHFWEDDDDILEERMKTLFWHMINEDVKHLTWFSLWDLGENFLVEGMHSGQIQRMKTHWFELVQKITSIFVSGIKSIIDNWHTLHIEWQGGNHDRTGKTNDMDRERTWALVIGELIQAYLTEYINKGLLTFNNEIKPTNVICLEEVKTVIIWNHGDWAWVKKNTHEIISLYGKGSEYYNIIVEGDKHHFSVKQDTNSIRIITASVKSGGQYAEDIIYKNSIAWYTKISFNEYNTPIVELRTFGI